MTDADFLESPASLVSRGGHTLADLALALTLVVVLSSLGARAWSRSVDRWAAGVAREAVVRAVLQARASAPLHGGAWVELSADSGLIRWGAGADKDLTFFT